MVHFIPSSSFLLVQSAIYSKGTWTSHPSSPTSTNRNIKSTNNSDKLHYGCRGVRTLRGRGVMCSVVCRSRYRTEKRDEQSTTKQGKQQKDRKSKTKSIMTPDIVGNLGSKKRTSSPFYPPIIPPLSPQTQGRSSGGFKFFNIQTRQMRSSYFHGKTGRL